PLSESTLNFRIFLSSRRPFREVLHIAVSMEAHYRDLSFQHNPFFDLFFQLLFFSFLLLRSRAICSTNKHICACTAA
ncbi:hypothetical protein ACM36D_004178, partial [Cronobacter sakazakii]